VHREVARLVDAGILSERRVGRTRLIRANDESPLVGPVREILTIATGPVVTLAEELARIDRIESAFLYGSFAARMLGDAGPAPHDIDVMVVGKPDVDAVYHACARVEAAVHRPVNPTIFLGGRRHRGAARALTPLTRVQHATVLALVEARRLEIVPADLARATSFLRQAEERLNQLPCSPASSSDTASPTTPATTRARHFWRRTASGRPTGPASTTPSAATSGRSSTSRPRRRRHASVTACDAPATRTATRPSRWVPRRPRRPSRSLGRCSTLPWPGV
jgi:hypothetical protein